MVAQQFALLECRDVEGLPTVYGAQTRLAERFFELERQWQAVTRALNELPDEPHAALRIRLLQFQAAAARATASNRRNLTALTALLLLGGSYETLVASTSLTAYNSSGCRTAGMPAQAIAVNQEG
jgi:hypothetical protein